LFVEEQISDFQGYELGDARAGQKKRFQKQPVVAFFTIGLRDKFLLFVAGETNNNILARFNSFDFQFAANLFTDITGLVVSQVILAPEFDGRGNQFF